MQYPITVVTTKPHFSIPSAWNFLRALKGKVGGGGLATGSLSLMLPVRIECVSPWESWLVQHHLIELGAEWEENFGRRRKVCTPWNMRGNLHLVVKFSVLDGYVRQPCLDWVTRQEFDAMQIPSICGESILLDYRHIMPHTEEA